MTLATGTKLGRYEIRSQIGAGGMGEVYCAYDARLKREVAIKLLPDGLAHDAERLARFEREARLLAAVNHPYIASVYGLENSDHIQFLEMELVRGKTVGERLAAGPSSINEALSIARQIA